MKLDGIRQQVFLDRYSLKDKKGRSTEKTPEEMWKRVARGIASVEKKQVRELWEKKFYQVMEGFKFVPGGRVLAGAGTSYAVTFYNCFVLPSPPDSRDGILDNLKAMIEIMARGGGVGINLSSLRPRGARVKKVNGFSSGPCNWAELYSIATHDIIQQGGSRRGALILMLWDWHPDIEEFVTVKQDLSRINGANLSVCVSDKFMEAVKNDSDWDLVFPDMNDKEYDEKWDGVLEHWKKQGRKVKHYKTLKARYLWDLICEGAWRSAEPGLVFMERYNKWYNNWYWNTVNCVNPCGEEGLPDWGVCNLGSLNLSVFVRGYSVDKPGEMDYASLAKHAKIAVRFQDDVVDADRYIFPEIEQMQLQGERRIGLGTMGLGDALIKMHLRYGGEESIPVIEKIFKTVRDAAYEASIEIAREKKPFPKFVANKHLKGYFIKQLPREIRQKMKKYGIRNSVLLQEAPTGTTSLLAGVSSGIEPVYEFEFIRRDRLGEHLMYHPLYKEWEESHSHDLPAGKKPDYFVSANDLIPEEHVRVQAAIQKYVDASISKTVNAPKAHTIEDVKNLYALAYELGCKGITYMREGSREGVLSRLETKQKEEKGTPQPVVNGQIIPVNGIAVIPRPMKLDGATYKMVTPIGPTFVTINHDEEGNPFEVFITIGKSGSDVSAMAEALGRLISLNLRAQATVSPLEKVGQVVGQLSGIGGFRAVGFGQNRVRSLPDAVSKILAMHFGIKTQNGNGTETAKPAEIKSLQPLPFEEKESLMDICPECGSAALALEEGCRKCYGCGYSEC